MRKRTPKLLALALAAVMTMGMTVSAATVPDNPAGKGTNVNSGDTMQNNNGIVMDNHGTVQNNNSIVQNNHDTVQNNKRIVQNNHGTVQNNHDTVQNNKRIVQNNHGTVQNNHGTVQNNNSIVQNNHDTVQNNKRIVQNNYGTVKNVGAGYVVNNFGGDVEGGVVDQYYELPVPQNFSYEGAKKSDDRWWINFPGTVAIKADEGYHFASTPTTTSGTVTEVEAGKTYTLSGVTKNLANGGLTLDVQEGEYTPEQPEPEPEPTPTPDPTPTTPPADTSTAAEPASAPTVQQMEQRERPDPQDVEATERYSFWMDVKSDVRIAADGKTLRVHVPAAYTNMPASVMELIRLQDEDITVDLRWSGEQLIITPATAQRKTALKAFWTFEQLCELYGE